MRQRLIYRGYSVNFVEYREEEEAPKEKRAKRERQQKKKVFILITDLPIKKGQAVEVAEYGRRRWKIENEGFNTQKRQGYNLRTSLQSQLSGNEEPILSDTNRSYGCADNRGMEKDLGRDSTK